MKKIICFLFAFLFVFPGLARAKSAVSEAALAAALQTAVRQNAPRPAGRQTEPLFSLFFNDTANKALFEQALGLAAYFPPPGAESFLTYPAGRHADVAGAALVFDNHQHILLQLRANNLPADMVGPHKDAVTITDTRAGGKRAFFVFFVTDALARPGASDEDTVARASVAIAHEIYGHAYRLFADKTLGSKPQKQQEKIAYAQSVAFLRRVIASAEYKKFSPKLQTAFQNVLANELKLLAAVQ